MEHKQDNGHVMFVKWDEEDDSTTLKSYAHKDDMHGTTNNANMGLAVRCDKDCDRVAANDAYHALVGQSDSPSDDDGPSGWVIFGYVVAGIGGITVIVVIGMQATGKINIFAQCRKTTKAPMGYAAANGNTVL